MPNFLPEVKFYLPTPEEEAKTLAMFCVPMSTGWDWSRYVYEAHPKLKELIGDSKDNEWIKTQCLEYSKSCLQQWEKQLGEIKDWYQSEWDINSNNILSILAEHFETTWPENKPVIIACISVCPIYPRNLEEYSFNVSSNGNLEFVKRIACHEILHLLYFKKWLEVFPETKREEMDAPYLVWKLSEIIAPIIMNNQPELKKLISMFSPPYDEFEKIEVEGKKLTVYFEELYKNYLDNKKQSFEEFLKLIWGRTLEFRSIIEKV